MTGHAGAVRERSLGVIGGLGPLASADFLSKLVAATEAHPDAGRFDIAFEQRPFARAADPSTATTARKLYVFDMIGSFKERGIGTVVLPCFLSHTFIEELQANSPLPIADMLVALRSHVRSKFSSVRRIGVLTSEPMRQQRLFERYFRSDELEIVHPRWYGELDGVTEAVYGAGGIVRGNRHGQPLELLREACADLVEQGAELILPGISELALVAHEIGPLSVPIVDAHRAYAQYVVSERFALPERPFRLGVVGGVGPAATVDFLQKLVRNTPARRDQDHLRLLIEQNPQIPDRTEHLVGAGADPTLALYATCKKLQAGEADLIVIPCNTAHAFVERIQPHLDIPIMNMLTVTVSHVRESFPTLRKVGLLATNGTISSGIYRRALEAEGLTEVVPRPAVQTRVMTAIYGPEGIKAGFTSGQCLDDIGAAMEDLISQGAEVIVLGCTELPLLFPRRELTSASGQRATLVDPTEILATRCVSEALARPRR
ncbi:MAG: aspartate racemase [Gammaproteobacteria bacterium]|nr:aspartate racemase [Gammaproteobacteria bacterium]